MELEGIMLREISLTEENKYCMISLICGIKKTKQTNKEKPLINREHVGGCQKHKDEGRESD